MRIPSTRLQAELARNLADAYLVMGTEPLLLGEARDQVRRACACDERQLFVIDKGFDFEVVKEEVQAGDLFGGRTLYEFVFAEAINSIQAGHLTEIADLAAGHGRPVVATTPQVLRKPKWLGALEKTFTIVEQQAVPAAHLPGWIKARARIKDLQLDDEAAELIAQLTEGDLGSAAQEIDKLHMIHGASQPITFAQVKDCVADNTRDSLLTFREAMAAGDSVRALRAVRNLKATKETPVLLTWALAEETRALLQLAAGKRPWGVFGEHQNNLRGMAKRVRIADVHALLAGVAKADWVAKGIGGFDIWIRIERLATAFVLLARRNRLYHELVRI